MTDQNAVPEWMLAANTEIAAQLGRITIDNATLRAQGRALAADNQRLGGELSEARGKLTRAEEELKAAKAELALLKGVKPEAAAPLAAHEAQG